MAYKAFNLDITIAHLSQFDALLALSGETQWALENELLFRPQCWAEEYWCGRLEFLRPMLYLFCVHQSPKLLGQHLSLVVN